MDSELIARISPEHRRRLAWFEEHQGEVSSAPAPLPGDLYLVSARKGIYKPADLPYALGRGLRDNPSVGAYQIAGDVSRVVARYFGASGRAWLVAENVWWRATLESPAQAVGSRPSVTPDTVESFAVGGGR